jgi:hypothetical protein
MLNYVSCDVRCHITCKTCTGTADNQCDKCPEGYERNVGLGTCTGTQIIINSIWLTSVSHPTTYYSYSSSSSPINTCGSITTLYGYRHTLADKHFTYSSGTIASPNYYAVSFRVSVLFVD